MPKCRGRPRKELSTTEFEKLCALQCNEEEICGWFGITDKTLCAWCKRTYGMTFSEAFKVYRVDGKIALRRIQFRLAEHSTAMAIHLGKNLLGQTDGRGQDAAASREPPDDGFIQALNAQAGDLFGGDADEPQGV